jgi:hypothetical protein
MCNNAILEGLLNPASIAWRGILIAADNDIKAKIKFDTETPILPPQHEQMKDVLLLTLLPVGHDSKAAYGV